MPMSTARGLPNPGRDPSTKDLALMQALQLEPIKTQKSGKLGVRQRVNRGGEIVEKEGGEKRKETKKGRGADIHFQQ